VFEVSDAVASDSGGDAIEAAVRARFAAPDAPEGVLVGPTAAGMAAVAGAGLAGRVLGRDFDLLGKEAIALLRRFRGQIMIMRGDVGNAGTFLARALLAAVERRDWAERLRLEVPLGMESAPGPCNGGKR
jgi:LacI family transcriptional regulator